MSTLETLTLDDLRALLIFCFWGVVFAVILGNFFYDLFGHLFHRFAQWLILRHAKKTRVYPR